MAYKTLHDFNSTSVFSIIYVTFPWVQSSQTSLTFFLDFEDKLFSTSRSLHLVIPGHIAHLSLIFARISFSSQLPCHLLMEPFLNRFIWSSHLPHHLHWYHLVILLSSNFYHMTLSCLFTSLSPFSMNCEHSYFLYYAESPLPGR